MKKDINKTIEKNVINAKPSKEDLRMFNSIFDGIKNYEADKTISNVVIQTKIEFGNYLFNRGYKITKFEVAWEKIK